MSQPLVTVLTATYNRPAYLPEAVQSVVNQQMADWEMLVINDGGTDVRAIVEGFGDERIRYFARERNQGKAACLNFGLEQARGRYIAYLDDDDVWYPNHLAVLTDILERNPEVGAAYSDLYRVLFIKGRHGRRIPLEKSVEVSRDYNRTFTFYFNHVLHVSLMHKRELGLRCGGYDPNVRVLIDWNITRKLSFYCGFVYVPAITGEYYAPVADSDRISDVQRRDEESYKQNLRRIRADLPPEPWPKVARVAVVLPMARWDDAERKVVACLADLLSYPCKIVLVNLDGTRSEPDCRCALGSLGELANISVLHAPPGTDLRGAYAYGVQRTEADYYYLPSDKLCRYAELRLIRAICYAQETGCQAVRWPEDEGQTGLYDALLTREAAAGGAEHSPETVTIPTGWLPRALRMDYLLHMARQCQEEGNYPLARRLLEQIAGMKHGAASGAYLVQLYASIAFAQGDYAGAEGMCRQLIDEGYGPDNWVRLGRIHQNKGEPTAAMDAYQRALEGIGLRDADVESDVFPLSCDRDYDAFLAMVGLGECLVDTGDLHRASRILRLASRLRMGNHRPHLAFGRLFLANGDLTRAEDALLLARSLAGENETGPIEAALATVYERRGDGQRAYACLRQALQVAPADADYAGRAAELARRSGRLVEAAAIYRDLLNHRPGHVPSLMALSHLCSELGLESEAADAAERAALLGSADA